MPIGNQKKGKESIRKILSTSTAYIPGARPQWTSDTRINYMSQTDFISYDIEEDQLQLIERVDNSPTSQIIFAKFLPLIGHYPVRVLYIYNDPQTKNYNLAVVPSFHFAEDYSIMPITINHKNCEFYQKNLTIISIGEITVLPDLQTAFLPVMLSDNKSYIMQIKLGSLGSSFYTIYDSQEEIQLKCQIIIKIIETKLPNILIVLSSTKIYLVRIVSSLKYLQKLAEVELKENATINSDNLVLYLNKIYLFVKTNNIIQGFYIDQDKFVALKPISHIGIAGISGSFNKLIYWTNDQPVIYQYRINQKNDTLHEVNVIRTQNAHVNKIINIVISQSARNALILAKVSLGADNPQPSIEPVIQFILFKLQLYTELNIPESSIYMQNLKYISRNKRVNKLSLPKINQKLYALTGSQVHSLDMHRMMGVMSFDIHPYGFYMMISYMFNIKIYSIEPRSMTLLYSFSMHNVKRVEYSPDGSTILLFSPRKIRLIDAYSFDLRYEYQQKNYNIVDICFGQKKSNYFMLLDNGTVIQRSFLSFDQTNTYHVFGHTHRRINCIKIDETNCILYFLIQNGTLLSKSMKDVTANEQLYEYEDGQKISDFMIQSKNRFLIIGTQSGNIRIHRNDLVDKKINFYRFYEKSVTNFEITSMVASQIENQLYIGNSVGDITLISYRPEIIRVNLGKKKEFDSTPDPQINNSKLIQYFTFQFSLVSLSKMQGDSEQNNLEDKLDGLVDKIQQHGSNYREQIYNNFIASTQKYENQKDSKGNIMIYRENQTKINKIKNDISKIREKYIKTCQKIKDQYNLKLRQVYAVQSELEEEKENLEKKLTRQKQIYQRQQATQKNDIETKFSTKQQEMQFFIKKEEFQNQLQGDFDQFQISEMDALKFYNQTLQEQWSVVKNKSRQLNKQNGYLQTAVKNMLSRKAQQQALLHRINQQLLMLSQVKWEQQDRISSLGNNLKSTQDIIHKIQNKVKATPNNVITSDKADSDLCSYKIWMKNKVSEEVENLEAYYTKVNNLFQKKSYEMVSTTNQKNKTMEKIKFAENKKMSIKQKLKIVKNRLITSHFHESNVLKTLTPQMLKEKQQKKNDDFEFDEKKVKKIASYQRINQKAIHFENKNIVNYRRKVRNLGNNNSELLNEYQSLKFSNKNLIDKQNKHLIEIKSTKREIEERNKNQRGVMSERTSFHGTEKKDETPFQKYVRHRKIKSRQSMTPYLQSAVSTPRKDYTPVFKKSSDKKP